jgi:hypothetical protein
MAIFAWRFQADVVRGDIDPVVTLFVGPERQVLDDNGDPTGETFVENSTADPVSVKLSELPGTLAAPITRKKGNA